MTSEVNTAVLWSEMLSNSNNFKLTSEGFVNKIKVYN